MVEGSGFLQWLSVFALATDPGLDVLLLDEPDAHLHSSLPARFVDAGSVRGWRVPCSATFCSTCSSAMPLSASVYGMVGAKSAIRTWRTCGPATRGSSCSSPSLPVGHPGKRRQVSQPRDPVLGIKIRARRLDEEPVVRKGQPELEMAIDAIGPLASDLQGVAVRLPILLSLEIGPEVLQRRNVDRGELVIAEPYPLARPARGKHLRAALHLDRRPAELPDSKAMKDRRLSGVVSAPEEGHSWV